MKRHSKRRGLPRHSGRVFMPGSDENAPGQRESRAEALERLRMETEANLLMHRPIR
ncbi:MAG: hypothetical protein ACTIJJ_05260 [Galactobacter sp.]|uniref:hypothetical protein n=1 Tax=Galactobacter sp. TaxID=2676125 RepID=UPI0025BEA633|nr:hypothetical protein [Galactobacter sp.]